MHGPCAVALRYLKQRKRRRWPWRGNPDSDYKVCVCPRKRETRSSRELEFEGRRKNKRKQRNEASQPGVPAVELKNQKRLDQVMCSNHAFKPCVQAMRSSHAFKIHAFRPCVQSCVQAMLQEFLQSSTRFNQASKKGLCSVVQQMHAGALPPTKGCG